MKMYSQNDLQINKCSEINSFLRGCCYLKYFYYLLFYNNIQDNVCWRFLINGNFIKKTVFYQFKLFNIIIKISVNLIEYGNLIFLISKNYFYGVFVQMIF